MVHKHRSLILISVALRKTPMCVHVTKKLTLNCKLSLNEGNLAVKIFAHLDGYSFPAYSYPLFN